MFLKYLGGVMVCIGAPWIFLTRAKAARRAPAASACSPPMERKESSMRNRIAASLAFFALFGGDRQRQGRRRVRLEAVAVPARPRPRPPKTLRQPRLGVLANDRQSQQSFRSADGPHPGRHGARISPCLLDWPGWDKPVASRAAPPGHGGKPHVDGGGHGRLSRPRLLVPARPLGPGALDPRRFARIAPRLGMPEDQKHISPCDLGKAPFRDPQTQSCPRFSAWAQALAFRPDSQLSAFEKKGMELARRLRDYQDLRAGRRLEAAPLPKSPERPWASIDCLLRAPLDERTDPKGLLRQLKEKFLAVRAAYLANSPGEFNRASAAFLAAAREVGPQLGPYPALAKIDLEVAYNHWVPFRFAWALAILSCVGVLLAMGTSSKWLYVAVVGRLRRQPASPCSPASACASGSPAAPGLQHVRVGDLRRAGRGPARHDPRTGLSKTLHPRGRLGRFRRHAHPRRQLPGDPRSQPSAAAADPAQQLLAGHARDEHHAELRGLCPGVGDRQPDAGLFYFAPKNQRAIESLSRFTYRSLQVGVVLLAAGTFLGGVWAASAWGRFWGWDPKEVWALISLLGYIAVLHARYAGWVKHFGLAVLSVACFMLVIVAWYGVNFLMGAGLHSYGFSASAGQGYVAGAIVLQTLYVLAAAVRTYGVGDSLALSASGRRG